MSQKEQFTVIPLRDVVVFPHMITPIFVGRPRSVKALHIANTTDKRLFLSLQKDAATDNPEQHDLNETGVIARVLQTLQLPDGNVKVLIEGLYRAKMTSFKLDDEGNVVNSQGYLLVPNITIPDDATQVNIGTDGTVTVVQGNETEVNELGQIETVNFINPAGLHALGDNLYLNTNASGDPIVGTPGLNGFGQLRQGFVETSNVKLVEEMTDLIVGQRAYEANSKSIQTADSMLQIVNQLKRN